MPFVAPDRHPQEPVPCREASVHEIVEGRPPKGGSDVSELAMTILKWALIFLLISIVAGVFGFTGISADTARFLFYMFVVIFLALAPDPESRDSQCAGAHRSSVLRTAPE